MSQRRMTKQTKIARMRSSKRQRAKRQTKKRKKEKRASKAEEEDDHEEEDDAEARGAISKKGAADGAGKKDGDVAASDEEDDVDEIILDSEGVWDQLLEDGDLGGPANSLLQAFATSGLNDENASGHKESKRQQRVRVRQQDILARLREVELLEIFLNHFAHQSPISIKILHELFGAMLSGGGSSAAGDGRKGKKTKVDHQLRQLELEFSRRVAGVLSRVTKHLSRGTVIRQVSQWHTEDVWEEKARALFNLGGGQKAAAVGQKAAEVGAFLFYWFCAVLRTKKVPPTTGVDGTESREDAAEMEETATQGWECAVAPLKKALSDWSTKKDASRWCTAVINTFGVRIPALVLSLPWCEEIKANRKPYERRAQISCLADILRNSPSDTFNSSQVAAKFTDTCADLLVESLDESANAQQGQQQKLRRDALRGLSVALKTRMKASTSSTKRGRRRNDSSAMRPLKHSVVEKINNVVTRVRDNCAVKRGEVYQLCWHVLKTIKASRSGGIHSGASETDVPGQGSPAMRPGKRPHAAKSSGDESTSVRSAKRHRSSSAARPAARSEESPRVTHVGSPRLAAKTPRV
eukprot:gnl/TRDRNA2_/TRDRNA2_164484_c0_seq1.p1 gnl/TRDRNA2_/TRDRNA2_164484_c0~~gnl/TRDRNA2_/TRDRNA2_164484_c0_seq1.p1  ORF type:complete len:580 (+),score=114.84 gnl/TRDRNA2_/TRDRNA2_164484_c0_seq1:1142-2881(+)